MFGDVGDIDAEFHADVAAFRLLVKHCEPKADELVEEESLKEWCLRVDRLVGFFHDFQSLQLPESDEASAIKDAIDRFQGLYSVLSSRVFLALFFGKMSLPEIHAASSSAKSIPNPSMPYS